MEFKYHGVVLDASLNCICFDRIFLYIFSDTCRYGYLLQINMCMKKIIKNIQTGNLGNELIEGKDNFLITIFVF